MGQLPAKNMVVLLVITVLLRISEAAEILIITPTPTYSHQSVFKPLTQALINRGHHVTLITTNPTYSDEESPKNLTEIGIAEAGLRIFNKRVKVKYCNKDNYIEARLEGLFEVQSESIDEALRIDRIKTFFKETGKDKFDLIILEAFAQPALVFAHVFKAPIVKLSTATSIFGNDEVIGTHVQQIWQPSVFATRVFNLTFWEKLKELYFYYRINKCLAEQEQRDEENWKKHFGDDAPKTKDLNDKVELLLVNAHPIWAMNKPLPVSAVYLGGGLQIGLPKELPKDLQTYLNSSAHGVIYVSFGNTVSDSNVPPLFLQRLVKTLSRLPYDVLWKWDGELEGGENIRFRKWFPQMDVLRHPQVKLFITQGGAQSTDEAILAGQPLLCFPLAADQWYNAENYVRHGIGVQLDPEEATEEDMMRAVFTVIEDQSYRENMHRLRDLITDQRQDPLTSAIWQVQRALHQGTALRSPSANMTQWEYLELDLAASLILVVIILVSVAWIGIKKFLGLLGNVIKCNFYLYAMRCANPLQ